MPCMQPIKLTAAKGLYQLATAGFSESLLLIFGSLAWGWSNFRTVDVVTRGETGETNRKSTQSLPMSSGLQTYPKPPQIPPEASGKKQADQLVIELKSHQGKNTTKKTPKLGAPIAFSAKLRSCCQHPPVWCNPAADSLPTRSSP